MPLNKSKGQMYPWVTHTHTHLGGECPHECSYCYVQAMVRRFGHDRYKGDLRFINDELKVKYGSGRTIFIEHCNDMWANAVPAEWRTDILQHCCEYTDNEYVFQTKNPHRFLSRIHKMPPRRLLGCTLESMNYDVIRDVSHVVPTPIERVASMVALRNLGERLFVTVEPILRGNMISLADAIADIQPEFVNVGADSKGTGLDEPTADDVAVLLNRLRENNIEIREKRNLERLLKS